MQDGSCGVFVVHTSPQPNPTSQQIYLKNADNVGSKNWVICAQLSQLLPQPQGEVVWHHFWKVMTKNAGFESARALESKEFDISWKFLGEVCDVWYSPPPTQLSNITVRQKQSGLVDEDGVNMRITITFAISAQWTVQHILERSWKTSTIFKILVMMKRMLVVVMSTKLTKQSRVYRGTWCVSRTKRGNWSRRSAALLLRRLRGTLTPRSLQQKINSWNVWFEKHCTAWNEAQKLDHFYKQTNKYQISFHS